MKTLLTAALLSTLLLGAENAPSPQISKKEHMLQEALAEEKATQTLVTCIKNSDDEAQLDTCREAHKKAMDTVHKNFRPPQGEQPPKR